MQTARRINRLPFFFAEKANAPELWTPRRSARPGISRASADEQSVSYLTDFSNSKQTGDHARCDCPIGPCRTGLEVVRSVRNDGGPGEPDDRPGADVALGGSRTTDATALDYRRDVLTMTACGHETA